MSVTTTSFSAALIELPSELLPFRIPRDEERDRLLERGLVRELIADVLIAFDANNPGLWALHCHLLYHLATGMFTTLRYV